MRSSTRTLDEPEQRSLTSKPPHLHTLESLPASYTHSDNCMAPDGAASGTAVRHGHTAGGGVRGRAAAAGARAGALSCTLQTMFCSRMQSAAGDARAAITDRIDQAAAGRAQPTRKAAPSRRDTLVFYGVSTEPRWDSIPLVHHRARAHAPSRAAAEPREHAARAPPPAGPSAPPAAFLSSTRRENGLAPVLPNQTRQ